MAPRGVIYVNTGKKVAVGYNSQVYGIWPIEANDENSNPIMFFPKTDEGWQSVNIEFQKIEKMGFGPTAEMIGNLNGPPQVQAVPTQSQYSQTVPQGYQIQPGSSSGNESNLSNQGNTENSASFSTPSPSRDVTAGGQIPTVPNSDMPPNPSFGYTPSMGNIPSVYRSESNSPSNPGLLPPQTQTQNADQTQFVGQSQYQNQTPRSFYGPPAGPPGYPGTPYQNGPSIYGQNYPQAPLNPYSQVPPPGPNPYNMPPPYSYGQPGMGQVPYGQVPPYPPNIAGGYYNQVKRPSSDSYAVASLVFGILGIPFFFFFGFFGVLAVYLSSKFSKRNRIALASGHGLQGKGLAMAGSITGFIGVLLYLILLLVNIH